MGTWNVAGRSPVGSLAVDLDEWLNLKDAADMYVLGYVTIERGSFYALYIMMNLKSNLTSNSKLLLYQIPGDCSLKSSHSDRSRGPNRSNKLEFTYWKNS